MTHAFDRRVTRLEDERPKPNRPYAIMPVPCKTTEEWLARIKEQAEGKGHYELLPLEVNSYVRFQRWVADPQESENFSRTVVGFPQRKPPTSEE